MQGEYIATVKEIQAPANPLIAPLRAALKRPMLVGQDHHRPGRSQREITIMADKSLPYEVLKKVMSTCTDADYGKISLAVMQKEKPVAAGQVKTGRRA